MIGCATVGECVCCEVASHSCNMNVILAINQKMGLVHHQLGQFTVTRNMFQNFITELVNQASKLFPGKDHFHIVYDGVQQHLNIVVSKPYEEHLTLCMPPPYSLFLNPVEQAHKGSSFKTFIKNELARQEIKAELVDNNARRLLAKTSSSGDVTSCYDSVKTVLGK